MPEQAAKGDEKIDPDQLTDLFSEHAAESGLPVLSRLGIESCLVYNLPSLFCQRKSNNGKDGAQRQDVNSPAG
jgi:hypothetical protein